jgi:hypothetical protein
MSEYDFQSVKQSFDGIFKTTFKIKTNAIPTVQQMELMSEVTDGVTVIQRSGKVFLLPSNMNKGTGLAFLCFFVLLGRSARLKRMTELFDKMRFLLLEKNLYTLAGIETGMFSELEKRYPKKVNLALGMASFLLFEKYEYNDDKKIKLAKDYPIYGFFRSFLEINKAKIGFGIPAQLQYENGAIIQTKDLPPKATQQNCEITKYYDFSKPKITSKGVEYEPSELVHSSNELMKKTLNQGQGIDRALKQYGLNIITLTDKKTDGEKKEILMYGLDGQLDIEDKNIILSYGPIKGSSRSIEKVNSDYKGDASFLNDIVRATFICKNVEQLKKFNSVFFKEMLKLNAKLPSRPKDKLSNPSPVGYGDLNMIFVLPNGFCCEVQISLIEMVIAKSIGHKLYERQRYLETKESLTPEEELEHKQLSEAQIEIFDTGRTNSGVETLAQLNKKKNRGKGKRASYNEVKFYDFDGMPAFTRNGKVYYIDYSNRFKESIMTVRFLHEAMLLTREQFNTLVSEFKDLIKIKE